MKKNYIFVLTLLLMIPFGVVFADDPKVLTVTAEADGSTINYAGTAEDGVTAVMCKLYDSSSEVVDKFSSPVQNGDFDGSFSDVANGTYTVSCARYEGGEVQSSEVKVTSSTVPSTSDSTTTTTGTSNNKSTSNVKTGDNIMIFVIISIISLVGIVSTIIINKKRTLRVR